MATGNKVPERLINFRVYNDGNVLLRRRDCGPVVHRSDE